MMKMQNILLSKTMPSLSLKKNCCLMMQAECPRDLLCKEWRPGHLYLLGCLNKQRRAGQAGGQTSQGFPEFFDFLRG